MINQVSDAYTYDVLCPLNALLSKIIVRLGNSDLCRNW